MNALLHDKDRRQVRLKAAEALFEIGAHASLARALTQVLEGEDNAVIGIDSARLLMRLGQGGAAAVPALTRMFNRSNREGAQIWAAKALVAVAPDDPRVATAFADALGDASHKGRTAAMNELAGVGPVELAAPALRAVSQGQDDDRFRAMAHKLLGTMHARRRERDRARVEFEHALALEPGDSKVRASLDELQTKPS